MNYTCYRGTVDIDGDLDKAAWASAPQTPRFAESGKLAFLDTRAALLWDDDCLYAAFWLEERDVWRIGLLRHQLVDQRLQCLATTTTPYPIGDGVHVPEDYSTVAFAASEAD